MISARGIRKSRSCLRVCPVPYCRTEREIFRLGFRARNDPSPLTGSPVLFEKGLFQELLTLPQGMGGSVLLRKYPAHVHTVYIADRNELADADTPEALAQLEALARQKL